MKARSVYRDKDSLQQFKLQEPMDSEVIIGRSQKFSCASRAVQAQLQAPQRLHFRLES